MHGSCAPHVSCVVAKFGMASNAHVYRIFGVQMSNAGLIVMQDGCISNVRIICRSFPLLLCKWHADGFHCYCTHDMQIFFILIVQRNAGLARIFLVVQEVTAEVKVA
jgi:hypothetical protein